MLTCALHGQFETYCDDCREQEIENIADVTDNEWDGD